MVRSAVVDKSSLEELEAGAVDEDAVLGRADKDGVVIVIYVGGHEDHVAYAVTLPLLAPVRGHIVGDHLGPGGAHGYGHAIPGVAGQRVIYVHGHEWHVTGVGDVDYPLDCVAGSAEVELAELLLGHFHAGHGNEDAVTVIVSEYRVAVEPLDIHDIADQIAFLVDVLHGHDHRDIVVLDLSGIK